MTRMRTASQAGRHSLIDGAGAVFGGASAAVERANQVWAMDITSIPMARGFVDLGAVQEALARHGRQRFSAPIRAARSRVSPASAPAP